MTPDPPRKPGLGSRAARSAAVSLGGNGLQILIGLASTPVLMRLLKPGDVGLMTMGLTLFAFVGSLSDFGLPHALVQRDRFDPNHAAGLFRLNRRLAVGLAVLLAASGPLVALFYGRREIIGISLAVAAAVGVAGVLNLHVALMRRQMRFKALTAGDTAGLIVGTLAAIAIAWGGGGYWALVVQLSVQQLGQGVMAWFRTGWRPTREANPTAAGSAEVADVRRYARDVALARVAANVGRNIDRVMVGTLAGAGPLGLYQKSYQWSVLPVQQVHQPLLNVAVSALSKLRRRDEGRYRQAVRQALLLVLTVTMPASLYLLVEARPAVRVLLGPQWGGAVPLFRVLCLGAFATGLTAATKWVYLAEGLTGRQLRWTLVSTPAMIACVAGGAVIGKLNGGDAGAALGTACGFSAGTLLLVVPTVAYCVRDSALTAADLWKPAWRPAAAAFLAAAILALLDADLPANPLARLALSAALYGVTYAMAWLALPGGFAAMRACRDVGKLLKK